MQLSGTEEAVAKSQNKQNDLKKLSQLESVVSIGPFDFVPFEFESNQENKNTAAEKRFYNGYKVYLQIVPTANISFISMFVIVANLCEKYWQALSAKQTKYRKTHVLSGDCSKMKTFRNAEFQ